MEHNAVEKGLVLFQTMVDPHSVVESTISWAIDNYLDSKPAAPRSSQGIPHTRTTTTIIRTTHSSSGEVDEETRKRWRKEHDEFVQRQIMASSQLDYLRRSGSTNYSDIYSVPPEYQYEARRIIEQNNMDDEEDED
jgi:hypothetical protein